MTALRVSLIRPCSNCPFRTDPPFYLRRDRRTDIANAIEHDPDGTFQCHKTIGDNPGQFCAGAIIALGPDYWRGNTYLQIAERLDWFDPERVDWSYPVLSFDDFRNGPTG